MVSKWGRRELSNPLPANRGLANAGRERNGKHCGHPDKVSAMPRQARIEVPGVPMHVTQRGVNRCAIFLDDEDRHHYRRLLREAWPPATPGLPETERQLTARLACSPFIAAVRAANAPSAPFLTGRCTPDGADQTAVYALEWR